MGDNIYLNMCLQLDNMIQELKSSSSEAKVDGNKYLKAIYDYCSILLTNMDRAVQFLFDEDMSSNMPDGNQLVRMLMNQAITQKAYEYEKKGDSQKATENHEIAFSLGSPISGLALASKYMTGKEKDVNKAIEYLESTLMLVDYYRDFYSEESIKRLLAILYLILGMLYADYDNMDALANIEAIECFKKAVENGNDAAEAELNRLGAR